jgi:hypothetical protein
VTRPYYETKQDLQNERNIAKIIEDVHNCKLIKMPIKLSLDFMAVRDGKAVAFIEARHRKNKMDKYPTYMISLYKVMMAKQLEATTGLPSLLAVQFSDKFAMIKLPPKNIETRIGGLTSRGDPQDIEPVVHFNINQFKVVKHERR